MSASSAAPAAPTSRTQVQKAARLVGIVFLLVGILGFIPGVTSHYSALKAASPDSMAMLFGVFQVSILHNIVHLIFGVLGLVLSRTVGAARKYLIVGGVIYLVLFIYGLVVPHNHSANFVPVNGADNVLHVVLGLGMILLGVVLTRNHRAATADQV